jgi:hypothetical protein
MTVVRKVYDYVECFLWANLFVFLGYFLIYIVPDLQEIRSRAESIRILKLSEENGAYCEKWGIKPGTHEHTLCKNDLQGLREKVEQEFADEQSLL